MDIQDKDLSIEQKIVNHLADIGIITKMGDVSRALKSLQYAKWVINTKVKDKENVPPSSNPDAPELPDNPNINTPGLEDDIKDAIQSGEIKIDGLECTECDHEALTNEEIQQIFDNADNIESDNKDKIDQII